MITMNIVNKVHKLDVHIEPNHLTSAKSFLADGASRNVEIADWSLKQSVANRIFQMLGEPEVDIMATEKVKNSSRLYYDKKTRLWQVTPLELM